MTAGKKAASFDDRLGLVSVVAVGAMVASLCWFKLSSLDTGFHIAYGRHFLETGHIVTFDPFLDPAIVRPFINGNWGTQVIMALVERAGGATGLIVLRWALLLVTFTAMAVVVRRLTCGWHWLAWVWMLAAVTAYERFSMRPELFGYAIMSLMLVVLVRGPRSWRGIGVLGCLQVAWSNLSFFYLVGLMLTGSFLGGAVIRCMTRRGNADSRETAIAQTKRLALALAVQGAVCFINPWHVRGALFPFQTLRFLQGQKVVGLEGEHGDGGSWTLITEFRHSFGFLGEMANYRTIEAYCVILVVAFVGLAALFARRRWGEAIVLSIFMVMSVQMRRNIAQFAIVGAPLSLCGIAAALPEKWSLRPVAIWLRRGFVSATIVAAIGWTWSIVDGRFYYDERRISREPGIGYSARFYPIEAARWLSSQSAVGPRLYVDLFTSSNVLPWLDRRYRPLVNTNTFVYSEEWLRQIMDVAAGRLDHRGFFREQDVDVVLLHVAPDTAPLIRALRVDVADWALVHVDPHMVIFLRRKPEHQAVIAEYRPGPENVDVDAWLKTACGLRYHRALSVATIAAAPWTLGWYEPAARLFVEALRLSPDSPPAWNYLGLCHGKLAEAAYRAGQADRVRDHLREAIRCFEQVLSMEPGNDVVEKSLAQAKDMLQSVH